MIGSYIMAVREILQNHCEPFHMNITVFAQAKKSAIKSRVIRRLPRTYPLHRHRYQRKQYSCSGTDVIIKTHYRIELQIFSSFPLVLMGDRTSIYLVQTHDLALPLADISAHRAGPSMPGGSPVVFLQSHEIGWKGSPREIIFPDVFV